MRESVGFVHLRAARSGGHPSPEGVSSLACHPKLFASVGQPTSAKATWAPFARVVSEGWRREWDSNPR
jgi:hypothetical protein